jgi:hypothetical protein
MGLRASFPTACASQRHCNVSSLFAVAMFQQVRMCSLAVVALLPTQSARK